MTHIHRTLLIAIAISTPAAVSGCQKKEPPPAVDSGPPPVVSVAPTVTELAPLADDAGDADASDAAAKHWVGPAVNPNQQKLQACCNAMRAQAKAMGSSPEANQLIGAAATCDTFVKQVGPAGSAPELAVIRGLLKSVKLPVACQ
jgi:hypothetical protein